LYVSKQPHAISEIFLHAVFISKGEERIYGTPISQQLPLTGMARVDDKDDQ
jgi:hypothetical protein